jgi:drug/metabolite transporter (DMT)-like permease
MLRRLKTSISFFKNLSSELQGIAIFILSCLLSALLNCVIRKVTMTFEPMLMVSYRSLGCIAMSLPLLFLLPKGQAKIGIFKKANVVKAAIDFLSLPLWAMAIAHIHISEAVSLSYLTPLFIAILAFFILKDKMETSGWLAMLIGFIGAYIVLLPDTAGFNFYSIFVLATCVLWALGGILTKSLSSQQHPIVIVLYTNIFIFLFSLPFADFRAVTLEEIIILAALSFLACYSHLALAFAFSKTRITVLLPFDYMRLIFAAIFAFGFYGEIIKSNTIIGAVIIIAAATYITSHKYRLSKETSLKPKPAKKLAYKKW